MSSEAIALAAFGLVCSLVAVIYWISRSRDDKQDEAMADHVREDVKVHERVVKVETEVGTLKEEVKALREMRHDILEHVSRTLGEWYINIVERLKK